MCCLRKSLHGFKQAPRSFASAPIYSPLGSTDLVCRISCSFGPSSMSILLQCTCKGIDFDPLFRNFRGEKISKFWTCVTKVTLIFPEWIPFSRGRRQPRKFPNNPIPRKFPDNPIPRKFLPPYREGRASNAEAYRIIRQRMPGGIARPHLFRECVLVVLYNDGAGRPLLRWHAWPAYRCSFLLLSPHSIFVFDIW